MEEYVSRDGKEEVGPIQFERRKEVNVALYHETILKLPGF